MKTPLTPAGIEPATFRLVVQHLNHIYIYKAVNMAAEANYNLFKKLRFVTENFMVLFVP